MGYKTWITGPDVSLSLHAEDGGINPEQLTGVIDTGASIIAADSRIIKRLGLVVRNRKDVQVADGRMVNCGVYPVRMVVPVLDFDDYVQVCALEMKYPSNRVLLGRSFLRDYIVNYNGPTERFEFHKSDDDGTFFQFDHDE